MLLVRPSNFSHSPLTLSPSRHYLSSFYFKWLSFLFWPFFLFFLSLLFFLFLPFNSQAQHASLRIISTLPDSVPESSGLFAVSPNKIYTHNDSGDQPRIFVIDTLGNLLRIIHIDQATAIDYEDITRDNAGNIYIGDFGNNFNMRTDLKVYKIPDPEQSISDTLIAEVINFSYPDQAFFPPPPTEMNFDCEGFFFFRDSLYLFSKNRGVSAYSHIYRLPSTAGNYIAQFVDSVYTGRWVTSAAINRSRSAFALLSETQVWLYTGFAKGNFSNLNGMKLSIDSTQKEAITFVNDSTLYISDERFLGAGGNLYELALGKWIRTLLPKPMFSVQVLNNPGLEGFSLMLTGSEYYNVEVIDPLGKIVTKTTVQQSEVPFRYYRRHAGVLLVRVTSAKGEEVVKKVLSF